MVHFSRTTHIGRVTEDGMKVLLLTCGEPGNKSNVYQALANALSLRNVICETLDVSAILGPVSNAERTLFSSTAVRTTRAFDFLYQPASFSPAGRKKSPIYDINNTFILRFEAYLNEQNFDAVITTALYPAEAMTYLKHKRDIRAKGFFVVTDYMSVPFLEETDMELIFLPEQSLVPAFVKRGIPAEKMDPSGIPVPEKYCYRTERGSARLSLELSPDIPTYLLIGGTEGLSDPMTVARKILERSKGRDCRIVVITGRNATLGDALRRRFEGDPRVLSIPFEQQVSMYMDACDVMVASPSAIRLTAAAVKGTPTIYLPSENAPENVNAQFFADRGMAIFSSTPDLAADNAVRLASDPDQCARMKQAMRQYIPDDAADHVSDRVMMACPDLVAG